MEIVKIIKTYSFSRCIRFPFVLPALPFIDTAVVDTCDASARCIAALKPAEPLLSSTLVKSAAIAIPGAQMLVSLVPCSACSVFSVPATAVSLSSVSVFSCRCRRRWWGDAPVPVKSRHPAGHRTSSTEISMWGD